MEAEARDAAEHTITAFDVEEPNLDQRNRCWLFLDVLFPFFLLTDAGYRRRNADRPLSFHQVAEFWRRSRPMLPKAPKAGQFFLMLLLVALVVNAGVVYIFLSISSMTPVMQMGEDHKLRNVTLKPRVGNHWTMATMGKYLLQIAIIYYQCWQVLEKDAVVAKLRVEDPGRLNKPGLVHFVRKLMARCFCYTFEEQWLSAHFIDHLLLVLVGFPYSILQPMLAGIHIHLRDHGVELQGALQGDALILLSGALGFYSGLLMVGFLCVTLGNGVKPRRGYAYIFHLLTLALAILMTLEFLVQQHARQRYGQFRLKEFFEQPSALGVVRTFMSASQLFATHSLCMLCAMLLGHAKHFERCPDLPWRVACQEALAVVGFLVMIGSLGYFERVGHLWPLCNPRSFIAGAIWEAVIFAMHIFGGFLLLAAGLQHAREVVKLRNDTDSKLLRAIRKLFDFDSFLIGITFFASIFHTMVEVYDLFAEKMYSLWALQILEMGYPVGLAVFTFAAWKNPPVQGLTRRLLWLALAFVMESFLHNQLLEDCEFTSHVPGCCAFPSMHDINAEGGHRLWEMCALDHRCGRKNPASRSENTTELFCKLPLDFHGHGHGSHAGHSHARTGGHEEEEASGISWGSEIVGPTCDEMKQHWSEFPSDLLIEENSEHEEAFSTAFKQIRAIGAAGLVEFNFALLGILMKVILFVAHPHSDRILQFRSESHSHTRHPTENSRSFDFRFPSTSTIIQPGTEH